MANIANRWRVLAITVGGASGAGARWVVVNAAGTATFPWPVLLINIAGSVLLGVLLAEEMTHPFARLVLHDAGGIGFCGGFTTFSTFAVDLVHLGQHGRLGAGAAYALLSVAGAIAGVVIGARLLGRLRSIMLPLEEAP